MLNLAILPTSILSNLCKEKLLILCSVKPKNLNFEISLGLGLWLIRAKFSRYFSNPPDPNLISEN